MSIYAQLRQIHYYSLTIYNSQYFIHARNYYSQLNTIAVLRNWPSKAVDLQASLRSCLVPLSLRRRRTLRLSRLNLPPPNSVDRRDPCCTNCDCDLSWQILDRCFTISSSLLCVSPSSPTCATVTQSPNSVVAKLC